MANKSIEFSLDPVPPPRGFVFELWALPDDDHERPCSWHTSTSSTSEDSLSFTQQRKKISRQDSLAAYIDDRHRRTRVLLKALYPFCTARRVREETRLLIYGHSQHGRIIQRAFLPHTQCAVFLLEDKADQRWFEYSCARLLLFRDDHTQLHRQHKQWPFLQWPLPNKDCKYLPPWHEEARLTQAPLRKRSFAHACGQPSMSPSVQRSVKFIRRRRSALKDACLEDKEDRAPDNTASSEDV